MNYSSIIGEIRDHTLHGESGGQGIREHTGDAPLEILLYIHLIVCKSKDRCTFMAAWEIEAMEHIKITYN